MSEQVQAPATQEVPVVAPASSGVEKYKHLRVGMTVAVDQTIKEVSPKGEERERIQTFEGVIIGHSGTGNARTITVRKIASGVGVEKIFPLNMPSIADIQVVKETKVRRAWLGHVRDNHARALKEKKVKK